MLVRSRYWFLPVATSEERAELRNWKTTENQIEGVSTRLLSPSLVPASQLRSRCCAVCALTHSPDGVAIQAIVRVPVVPRSSIVL
jgi:hypothetical protein